MPALDGPDGAPLEAALALADIPLLARDPLANPSEDDSPMEVAGAELPWEVPLPGATNDELPGCDEAPTLLAEDGDTCEVPARLDPPDAAREEDTCREEAPLPPDDAPSDVDARLLPAAPELPPPVRAHQPSTHSKPSVQSAGDWQLKRASSALGSGHPRTTGKNAKLATQRNHMCHSVPEAPAGTGRILHHPRRTGRAHPVGAGLQRAAKNARWTSHPGPTTRPPRRPKACVDHETPDGLAIAVRAADRLRAWSARSGRLCTGHPPQRDARQFTKTGSSAPGRSFVPAP